MTIHLGDVPANSTLYIPFATYNSAGASVTMTGFAIGDILIYKNGSTTQRSSTAGFVLLDTDGTDFDGVTGLQGFSVDLSDNTDAGFYAVGGFYWVVVSTVTIDGQVVTLIAATLRIVAAEAVTGKPKVDVDAFGGSAGTFAAGIPDVKVNNIAANAITATSINADAITAAKVAADVSQEIRAEIDSNSTQLTAIKTQTDKLTFTVANQIDANIQSVNDTTVNGAGTAGNPWGP